MYSNTDIPVADPAALRTEILQLLSGETKLTSQQMLDALAESKNKEAIRSAQRMSRVLNVMSYASLIASHKPHSGQARWSILPAGAALLVIKIS